MTIKLPKTDTKNLEWLYPLLDLIRSPITITDETSNILYVNEAYQKMTGYTSQEVVGQNPGILRSGYHDDEFYNNLWSSLKNTGLWHGDIWNRNKFGKVFPASLTISKMIDPNDQKIYYVGIFEDLLHVKAKDAAAINLTLYDFLTKLPNRLALDEHYNLMLKNILQDSTDASTNLTNKLAVVYIDLIEFKNVNAQYGFVAGDRLLAKIAAKIQMITHAEDYLARIENDHFVILMRDPPDDSELEEYFYKIYDIFNAPFVIDGINIYSSCSIGVARLMDKTESLSQLINRAKLVKK